MKHHNISAPPSTPKTPVEAGDHSPGDASARQAGQQQEGSQAADWAVFTAHGLHVDPTLLAQAHAAMLTIESEGACPHLHFFTHVQICITHWTGWHPSTSACISPCVISWGSWDRVSIVSTAVEGREVSCCIAENSGSQGLCRVYPGWVQETETARDDESKARELLDVEKQQQETADEQLAEEPHDQSCTDTAAAAAAEQEGGCSPLTAIQ